MPKLIVKELAVVPEAVYPAEMQLNTGYFTLLKREAGDSQVGNLFFGKPPSHNSYSRYHLSPALDPKSHRERLSTFYFE